MPLGPATLGAQGPLHVGGLDLGDSPGPSSKEVCERHDEAKAGSGDESMISGVELETCSVGSLIHGLQRNVMRTRWLGELQLPPTAAHGEDGNWSLASTMGA